MARSDTRHDRGVARSAAVLVLTLALAGGGVAVWRYDLIDRLRDGAAPTGPADPATVAPPPGVEAPAVTEPDPVAATSPTSGALDAAAVRRTLAAYLDDPDLGRHVLAEVTSLAGGPPVLVRGDGTAIPASTTKIVTGTAALLALGPDHVFTTEVRAAGGNRIALVGGGDPFLERGPVALDGEPWPYPARADLATLAGSTAAALRRDGTRGVRLVYDESLFSGPSVNPTWERDYVPDDIAPPTSALWVDAGRERVGFGRVADPAAEAAASFAAALTDAGVTVRGTPVAAIVGDSPPLASVRSAPVAQIVERLLEVSDNEASEVLLRHVGLATGGAGSIEAGRDGVRSLLRRAGVVLGPSVFHDGSGLSRANRADPSLLTAVLRLAAAPGHPELRAVLAGLPVAGFTGSLTDRMDEGPPAGLGRVRAKTGTLTEVSSLAGIATDIDGTVLVFVLMADRIKRADAVEAQVALDSAAAALGACSCTR